MFCASRRVTHVADRSSTDRHLGAHHVAVQPPTALVSSRSRSRLAVIHTRYCTCTCTCTCSLAPGVNVVHHPSSAHTTAALLCFCRLPAALRLPLPPPTNPTRHCLPAQREPLSSTPRRRRPHRSATSPQQRQANHQRRSKTCRPCSPILPRRRLLPRPWTPESAPSICVGGFAPCLVATPTVASATSTSRP